VTTKITRRKAIASGLAAAAALPFAGPAGAQSNWPSKPIKIICGWPAGGLTDLFARAYGEYLQEKTGQTVTVENKTGAGGILGAQTVKSAPADGYTLMFTISATMIMNRVLYKSLPYDADKDFQLISYMSAGQLPFVIAASSGAKTIDEFFEMAKTKKFTFGTYGAGTYAHIAITELNKKFGTDIGIVHYRGEAPMWQDFNAGVIQAATGSYQAASNALKSGVGIPVAVPRRRSKPLPDVKTFQEQGFDQDVFKLSGFICLVGPTGMPQEAIDKLSTMMVEGGKSERVQKLLDTFGVDESAQGKDEFRKLYDFEKPIWIRLVGELNLTPQ
jgi:tripartite-type tricarboxylate transporter receptor subunit TctC